MASKNPTFGARKGNASKGSAPTHGVAGPNKPTGKPITGVPKHY